ncbi:BLUF domain-containing protein [Roseobacter sp.]|uniref:BLUF domain-containing protein n=1 Tax=Roseobacter sp. TaxID=1907202 RepID=UPI00385C56AD
MLQLIYVSRPFGYDLNMLASILATSRVRNAQSDVTGALICRSDIFLQLLEGPASQVEMTFKRICQDDRHVDIQRLVSQPVEDRMFGNWAMKHDPAESWLWSPGQIQDGALENASESEIRSIFERSSEAG